MSQSGGETTNNVHEYNPVYNIIYPGYYYNGISESNGMYVKWKTFLDKMMNHVQAIYEVIFELQINCFINIQKC